MNRGAASTGIDTITGKLYRRLTAPV